MNTLNSLSDKLVISVPLVVFSSYFLVLSLETNFCDLAFALTFLVSTKLGETLINSGL